MIPTTALATAPRRADAAGAAAAGAGRSARTTVAVLAASALLSAVLADTEFPEAPASGVPLRVLLVGAAPTLVTVAAIRPARPGAAPRPLARALVAAPRPLRAGSGRG